MRHAARVSQPVAVGGILHTAFVRQGVLVVARVPMAALAIWIAGACPEHPLEIVGALACSGTEQLYDGVEDGSFLSLSMTVKQFLLHPA